MSSAQKKNHDLSKRFVQGAGQMGDTSQMPAPVRWVVQLIQYMIAMMLVAFAKAIKHTVRKQDDKKHPTTAGERKLE